jgi:hypothetical protein
MINRYLRKKLRVRGEVPPFVGYAPTTRENVLPEVFKELGYKVGAEIGVQRGIFSKLLCESIPGLKLYCVDPWVSYRNMPSERGNEKCFRIATSDLAPFDTTILRKTSKDALEDVPDGSLDFVYIDGLHDFDNVMFDIIGWGRKVRRGGIVSGHDFFYWHGIGVVYAVEAYVRAHNIQQWFITKEFPNSWFFVKP